MANNKFKLITCVSGDWEVVMINGKMYYDGHTVPNHVWTELIKGCGYEVEEVVMRIWKWVIIKIKRRLHNEI